MNIFLILGSLRSGKTTLANAIVNANVVYCDSDFNIEIHGKTSVAGTRNIDAFKVNKDICVTKTGDTFSGDFLSFRKFLAENDVDCNIYELSALKVS